MRPSRSIHPLSWLTAVLLAAAPAVAAPVAVAAPAAPAALPANLTWHTDLDAARAEAKRTGRPILSLRLLGRLDQELSCANSRFFRTFIYPDPEVNALLADRFVLHWASERPAPRITIDYGDGRVLERTITGNSVHYVLDAEGRPIDAIPGLWGPAAFAVQLRKDEALERSLRRFVGQERVRLLAEAHRTELEMGIVQFGPAATIPRGGPRPVAWNATRAGNRALSKSIVEMPIIRRITGISDVGGIESEPDRFASPFLRRDVSPSNVRLSEPSLRIMRALEGPGSGAPHAGAAGDPAAERAFTRMVMGTRMALARDEALNREMLHPAIHEWFMAEDVVARGGWTLEDLNREIYATLFLTPASDPWLGLVPAEVYAGLPRGGLRP